MDLRNLNTFMHVAELGSFSKAAQRLGYSQPTVSVQVRLLEETLGAQLFDRIGHSIRLTDKGRETLAYAQQICSLCQQLTHNASEEPSAPTVIRLATADSLCFPLVSRQFAAFRRKHPGIQIKLITAGTGEMFRMLDHNEVDLVCTLDNRIYNTGYTIASEEQVGIHFLLPKEHPLAQRSVLTRKDLANAPLLLTEKGMSYRRLLDQWLAEGSVESQPILECGSADLLCALVEEGTGISFLPDYVSEEAVRRGALVRRDAENFRPVLWKQVLHHRNKWISPPMQKVIDHLASIRLQPSRNAP